MMNRNTTTKQSKDNIPLIVQSTSSSALEEEDDDDENNRNNDNNNNNNNNDITKARTKPRGLMRLFGGGKKKTISHEPVVIVHTREASVPIQVAAVSETTPQSVEHGEMITPTNEPDENDTAKESETPSLSEALDVESGPVHTGTVRQMYIIRIIIQLANLSCWLRNEISF
jgi:hypothetical protein